jgi:hypothetical protein
MIVLGPLGMGAVGKGLDAYGVGAGESSVVISGTMEVVVCSGDAGELASGVVTTEYETGISLEDTMVLLAGQSVTSSAQDVIVTADVE